MTRPEPARRAGVLIHPSSLPGPYGVGDIGPEARRLIAWLEAAGQRIWQVLPLNPVDGLGCPYASPSAFASEPLLISIDDLVDDGWLRPSERPAAPGNPWVVDWAWVAHHKGRALALAADRVAATVDLERWGAANPWALDWARFDAIRAVHGGDWPTWPAALQDARAAEAPAAGTRRALALQWLFEHQWARLRAAADAVGIAIWGDLPMFVGASSADTWARPELFQLGPDHRPRVVTGCPPDAFSPTGQRWGHAHFDVAAHRAEGHAWWLDRVGRLLAQVDAVRLDHFRGLAAVWHIPAADEDATGGAWVEGLGAPLLQAIRDRFARVPIVAEDLGVITPDVEALRDDFELPGMAILQFAFSGLYDAEHPYLPHNHRPRLVVYPGTHDNDTVVGWYRSADGGTRDHVRRYLSVSGADIAGDLVRAAYRSVADTAIVAMQDLLSLDSDARMNLPGSAEGNWSWRCGSEAFNLPLARRLRDDASLCGRVPSLDPVPSAAAPESP